jgi:hypothetical protein
MLRRAARYFPLFSMFPFCYGQLNATQRDMRGKKSRFCPLSREVVLTMEIAMLSHQRAILPRHPLST